MSIFPMVAHACFLYGQAYEANKQNITMTTKERDKVIKESLRFAYDFASHCQSASDIVYLQKEIRKSWLRPGRNPYIHGKRLSWEDVSYLQIAHHIAEWCKKKPDVNTLIMCSLRTVSLYQMFMKLDLSQLYIIEKYKELDKQTKVFLEYPFRSEWFNIN